MQQHTDSVTTRAGSVVSGASVLVKTYPAGATAKIYSDDGSTEQDNPITTDADGRFSFYAADGRYTLVISKSGVITQTTLTDAVHLWDPDDGTAEQDAADVSFVQSGSGAITRTMQDKERDIVSVFDFFSAAQVSDVRARTGLVNVASAIQAAVDYATTVGCILFFPAGLYLIGTTTIVFKNFVTYRGSGKADGVSLGTFFRYTGTSDAIQINNPVNSSTRADISIEDMWVHCTVRTAKKAAIADLGSTFLSIKRVRVSGNDFGIILDQSELADLDECDFEVNGTSAAGALWVTNGADRTVGASALFTNRISVKRSQFNSNVGGIAIVDDGGNVHVYEDNNCNAFANHGRFAGVVGLSIRGGEWESATSTILLFTNTSYHSGGAVGQCTGIDFDGSPLFVPATGQSVINFTNGTDVKFGAVYFGNTSAVKVIGTSNVANLIASGPIINAGGGATFDGEATNHTDLNPASGTKIRFPATQNASSNANTLDDYEESNWTPVLTAVTPGDIAVTYSRQVGRATKIGRLVCVSFDVITSAFTHTTASDEVRISGLPYVATSALEHIGSLIWTGITKAGYAQINSRLVEGDNQIRFIGSQSGAALSGVLITEMPTGGSVRLTGAVNYIV